MFGVKDQNLDTKKIVDEIEKAVYAEVKPLGFRKHGRTLHRFVDGDISQVINFQNGCAPKGYYDVLWVNVGIRIPECMLRAFAPEAEIKKYYHEYDCNMRARLGEVEGKKEREYDLHDPVEEITSDIIRQIRSYVIPAFNVLNSRTAILADRKDPMCHCGLTRRLTLLEESMIYGRMGEMQKAEELFNRYYDSVLKEYKEHEGWKSYRHKRGHLEYLGELASELNIKIINKL